MDKSSIERELSELAQQERQIKERRGYLLRALTGGVEPREDPITTQAIAEVALAHEARNQRKQMAAESLSSFASQVIDKYRREALDNLRTTNIATEGESAFTEGEGEGNSDDDDDDGEEYGYSQLDFDEAELPQSRGPDGEYLDPDERYDEKRRELHYGIA